MKSRSSNSVYVKALVHLLAMVAAGVALIAIVPDLLRRMELSSEASSMIEWALAILWLMAGGMGSLLLACPRCGKSPFMRGMISMPWPARICSRCGTDLTLGTDT